MRMYQKLKFKQRDTKSLAQKQSACLAGQKLWDVGGEIQNHNQLYQKDYYIL